jgi:hypothetical protein
MLVTRGSAGRAAGAIAVAAAVIAAVVFAPASASAGTPACSTSTLVVWLDTQGNGAAGSSFYNLQFTNLSKHACRLFGYPGVAAVDLGGSQIGRAASRDSVHPASSVTLPAGGSAHTILRIVDAQNYPGSLCGPATAAGLRVYPPGQTASKVVPFPFAACSRNSAHVLSVEVVQQGLGVTR